MTLWWRQEPFTFKIESGFNIKSIVSVYDVLNNILYEGISSHIHD